MNWARGACVKVNTSFRTSGGRVQIGAREFRIVRRYEVARVSFSSTVESYCHNAV